MEQKDIDRIKAEISSKYLPDKLYLFGSAAAGKLQEASDLDFCVIKENIGNKSDEFVKIRKILGRTVIPLDILIFTREEFNRRKDIWGTVQYEIDKNGKLLYESK
jgi:predicted nucleotidyltransferase